MTPDATGGANGHGNPAGAAAVVLGAGTAGLNAALQLARRGLQVTVVESRRLGEGGARWDNGVLDWQYTRAGIAPPTPDEVHDTTGVTRLYGPADAGPVTVQSPTRHADMRRLNDRLVGLCRAEGVAFVDRARDVVVSEVDGRVRALDLVGCDPDDGPSDGQHGDEAGARALHLEADLFVDAAGRHGVLRSQVRDLVQWCPPVARDLLCTASQFMFRVAEVDGARRFLDRRGVRAGDGVTWVGLDGGFSALAVTVQPDLERVSVLTGT
ncbi:MAG TPA: FAD-dependent oxidoreductase, partial [Microthrixaceae bacterium]|nr:FAD-dependent oxidoreductase [Microthrixaceae bacterium]